MDIYLHQIPLGSQSIHVSIFFPRKKGNRRDFVSRADRKKYQRFTEQNIATRPEWNNEAHNEHGFQRYSWAPSGERGTILEFRDGSVGDAWKAIVLPWTCLKARCIVELNETFCELTNLEEIRSRINSRHFEITFAIVFNRCLTVADGKLPRTISITRDNLARIIYLDTNFLRHRFLSHEDERCKLTGLVR